VVDARSVDGHDFPVGEGNDVSTAFVLGVAVGDLLGRLPRSGVVFTDSLKDEALLIASGFRGCYIYRARDAAFERAAELALAWLAELGARAREAGNGAELLFGDVTLPAWALSYDALFEIKGGIFDSIFHSVLAEEICTAAYGAVQVYASKDNQLGAAVVQFLGGRGRVEWQDQNVPAISVTGVSPVMRLWRRFDGLLIHNLLVGLRGIWEGRRRHGRIALLGTSGDMARLGRDSRGRLCVSDVYYENLELALDAASPDILKVGINSPRIAKSDLKNSFLVWRLILSGAFRPWYAYATPKDVLMVLRERRTYRAALAGSDVDPNFRALFEVGGFSFYSLLRPKLTEMLPGMLAAARFHHAIAERFVSREKVGLVISVESFSNLGRCLASALHRHGGQLWGIQGGIISPRRVTNSGFHVPALGAQKALLPDIFFAWGPAYCRLLERFGIPAQRLRMMGFNRAKRLPKGLPNQGVKWIVYVTGGNALVCPYLMTSEEEYHTLKVLAACLPEGAKLLVRAHPRHDVEDFRRHLANWPHVRVLAAADMSLEECLVDASCIVGKASTVLLEAAQAGRRVLLLNLGGTPDFTGFSEGVEFLPYATDVASLRYWLARILAQEDVEAAQSLERFSAAWCAGDAHSAVSVLQGELETFQQSAS
jgi:hypothetical protein